MNALLKKELRLTALPLTYFFIAFALMALIPGYPILCGVFFITLGIFQSFQSAREANDIVYSALMPVAKRDIVTAKYRFVLLIELGGIVLMALSTILRMTVWADAAVYRHNAMMNANPFFLGMALTLFGLFNIVFVGGFWKTAYKIGKPFIIYSVIAFLTIGVSETLHHIPGLGVLNAYGFDHAALQLALMLCGAALFAGLTYASYRKACADFEKIDL